MTDENYNWHIKAPSYPFLIQEDVVYNGLNNRMFTFGITPSKSSDYLLQEISIMAKENLAGASTFLIPKINIKSIDAYGNLTAPKTPVPVPLFANPGISEKFPYILSANVSIPVEGSGVFFVEVSNFDPVVASNGIIFLFAGRLFPKGGYLDVRF